MGSVLPTAAGPAMARLVEARFVPVVRASTGDKALIAARAFLAGGCRVLEIAMTVPGAGDVIRVLAGEGHFVGAGTVLDLEGAREVASAGAKYLVGPTTDAEVIAFGRAEGLVVVPGALTPNEVLAAHRAGAEVIKVFPVASVGGPRYLKLLKDPFPQLKFFASGGVTLESAPEYLEAGAVAMGIGSALVNPARVEAEDAAWLTAETEKWCRALH